MGVPVLVASTRPAVLAQYSSVPILVVRIPEDTPERHGSHPGFFLRSAMRRVTRVICRECMTRAATKCDLPHRAASLNCRSYVGVGSLQAAPSQTLYFPIAAAVTGNKVADELDKTYGAVAQTD